MPTNRRRRQVRRHSKWTEGHVDQLRHGFDFFDSAWGNPELPPDRQHTWPDAGTFGEMEECWSVYGAELLADAIEAGVERPWFWFVLQLREEPRLRMGNDPNVPATTTRPPRGECWQGTFHEPVLMYLHRIGQLQDGEVERLRAAERAPGVGHSLDYYRRAAEANPKYAENILRKPWELACLHVAYDADGARDLLTPDELRAAGPYIRQLSVSPSQED